MFPILLTALSLMVPPPQKKDQKISRDRINYWKFQNFYGMPKRKVFNFISFLGQVDSPWWDDSKTGRRIEIGWYLNPFSAKKVHKLQNIEFCQFFDRFLAKWVKYQQISILRSVSKSPHQGESSWPKNQTNLRTLFLASYRNFKNSSNFSDP